MNKHAINSKNYYCELNFELHVSLLLKQCSQRMYLLRLLCISQLPNLFIATSSTLLWQQAGSVLASKVPRMLCTAQELVAARRSTAY